MAKKIIRLTESDLHRVVEDSVRSILREMDDDPIDDEPMEGEFDDDAYEGPPDWFVMGWQPGQTWEDHPEDMENPLDEPFDTTYDDDSLEDYDPPVDPDYNPFYVNKLIVNGEDITDGFLEYVNISDVRVPNNLFHNEDEFKQYLDMYFQYDNIGIDLDIDNDGKPVITTNDPRYDIKVIGGHRDR